MYCRTNDFRKMLFYHKPWTELMFQLASTPWTLLRVTPQSAIVASLTKNVQWEFFQNILSDIEFVKNFTPSDFQEKNFTPSISPNLNGFSKKKTQKMSENGEIYTAGKNFTLPPALTAWTNSTSELKLVHKKGQKTKKT